VKPLKQRMLVLTVAALATIGATIGAAVAKQDRPASDTLVVATTNGPVRGRATENGRVYLGVPFAAPPIGPLRFAAPAPAHKWTTVRDATLPAAACPQVSALKDFSEDCLHLNVFVPRDARPGARLPVMVWVHGGAYNEGSNAVFDGSRLADAQHVIVVSPNYRLGAFGFLAHPALATAGGEGNYGMLDLQAALRWVAANARAFGGDPKRVTMFGQSAGASAVCTQMLMPGSNRLFQRSILESDTCIFPDTYVDKAEAESGGRTMTAELGCKDDADAVACLRALPVEALLAAKSARRGSFGANGWAPMAGGDVLPQSPAALFKAGRAPAMPVIVGSNHDEGTVFVNQFMPLVATQPGYAMMVAQAIPPAHVAAVMAEYQDLAAKSYPEALTAIITDSHFACPILTFHRLIGSRAPFYAYEFSDPHAPRAFVQAPGGPDPRAYHGAELAYVFQTSWAGTDASTLTPVQRKLAVDMQNRWGAFAATAKPTAASQAPWPTFDGRQPLSFAPGEGETFVADFAKAHRCDFWNAHGH